MIEWFGVASATVVASLVSSAIDRVASNSVQLSSNTVDGALRAASTELVGEEDTFWCFLHQFALPIKKSLVDVVGLDFQFMHSFGVFLRSHSASQEKLDRIRVARLGKEKELALLIDSLARWMSEWQKLKRFLELQDDLITLAKDEEIKSVLKEWIEDELAPTDVFKPKFWGRLNALQPTFALLHSIVKASQTSTVVVLSTMPWWLKQIELHLRMNVEDEPSAVRLWKEKFLKLFLKQFDDLQSEVNLMWTATALDPRFSDLGFFGVDEKMQGEIWEQIKAEHTELKEKRLGVVEFTAAKQKLGLSLVEAVRESLKLHSTKFLTDLESKKGDEQAKYHVSIDPLAWWSQQSKKDDCYEFKEVAATACMLLSSPDLLRLSEELADFIHSFSNHAQ